MAFDKRKLVKNYTGSISSVFPQCIDKTRLTEVEVLNMELEYEKIGINEYLTYLLPSEIETTPLYLSLVK